MRVAPEVRAALDRGNPVVGLETTILAFGLPAPLNAQVGAECEAAVRAEGAVPATLAILDGRVCAGLEADEVARFCSGDPAIRKVNLQNFAAALTAGAPGALTVAASLQACALAGIRVFATGGIGGVHRGWTRTPDISSDLAALARFPAVTVCAGAKSILDVPATLEALESLGVPVAGCRAEEFPLFYARGGGHRLEDNFATEEELARFAAAHFDVSGTGILAVTPVPVEHALDPARLAEWTRRALDDAEREGKTGRAVTPFLLARLVKLSGGATLDANRALVANNARVAARIAAALARGARRP
jgi:pseudouridine-5'-phosphate glycosidase